MFPQLVLLVLMPLPGLVPAECFENIMDDPYHLASRVTSPRPVSPIPALNSLASTPTRVSCMTSPETSLHVLSSGMTSTCLATPCTNAAGVSVRVGQFRTNKNWRAVCPISTRKNAFVLAPELLLPRPLYPPSLRNVCQKMNSTTGSAPEGVHILEEDSAFLLHECSCADIKMLESRLVNLEYEQRALSRKILRLETLFKDLVDTFLASDDIALFERNACLAVVYNEQLTKKRAPRLLRDGLKKLCGQYML